MFFKKKEKKPKEEKPKEEKPKEEKPKEEKPKEEQICVCNHIYCQFVTMDDPKRMTTDVFMKCAYCNETTKISTIGELANLFKYGRL